MEWSEQRIIKGCKKQSKKAQRILLHRYKDEFFGICLRYVDNEGVAEEILMDAFIAIFKKIYLYKENSFKSWMKTIVIHKAIDYYRKHKNDPYFSNIENEEWRISGKMQENNLETTELLRMLSTLPPGYRLVFNLYVIEGYSHKEISEQLSVTVSTSKTQLKKAKTRLKEILEKGGYYG